MNIFWRIIGFCIPFVMLFCFVWMDIQPGGVLTTQLTPGTRTPYLYAPLPDARIRAGEYEGEKVYDMTGEPAYISLRLPQTAYDRVTVGVDFIPVGQTMLEIGPETKDASQAFDLKPLYQSFVEQLHWPSHKEGDVTVYEKDPGVDSYARGDVATYAYDFPLPYRDLAYMPSSARHVYDVDLRGTHRMKTYIKNEPLDMRFVLTDMNRELGRDDVTVQVYDESHRLVKELTIADDGNERTDQQVTPHDLELYETGLPEGVYEVDLSTTTDVFIRTIDTPQQKLIFLNRLYAGDAVGWREAPAHTNYVGNGQAYTLETLHNEGLQSVSFDHASVPIEATHKQVQFILEKPKSQLRITIPKGDVSVVSEGVFALTPESFFVPDARSVGPFTNVEDLGVDALYTTYTPVTHDGAWMHAEESFDASTWWQSGRRNVRMALSAPFIATQNGHVYIKRVTVRFEKTPIHTFAGLWLAIRERIPFGL